MKIVTYHADTVQQQNPSEITYLVKLMIWNVESAILIELKPLEMVDLYFA